MTKGKKAPGKQQQPAGHITDPKTHQRIDVVPRKGESQEQAMERLQKKHSGNS